MRSVGSAIFGLMIMFGAHTAAAQQQPTAPPNPPNNPLTGSNLVTFFSNRTPYEFWLTCLICAVGLSVIIILTLSMHRIGRLRPEDISRPVIIVTIIFGTLILVTAGYSNEQIAPAFGLFGTIVGYILGRMSQPAKPAEQEPPATAPSLAEPGVPAPIVPDPTSSTAERP